MFIIVTSMIRVCIVGEPYGVVDDIGLLFCCHKIIIFVGGFLFRGGYTFFTTCSQFISYEHLVIGEKRDSGEIKLN